MSLQDLNQKFSIVDQEGRPTDYLMRLLRDRKVQAEDVETVVNELIARQVIAGIGLDGGGPLGGPGDITIDANVQEILDNISTTRGSVLYRGATDWAALAPGTAGQVLQTNGTGADPTWVTPSGGGGSGRVKYPSLSGRYYPPDTYQFSLSTTSTAGANSLIAHPFSRIMTISELAMEVTTASAGNNIQMALYDSDSTTGLPKNLIAASASIPTDTAVTKTYTLPTPYNNTGLVWLCRNMTATMTLRAMGKFNTYAIFGETALNSTSSPGAISISKTYGTWPSDLTGESWSISTATATIAAK